MANASEHFTTTSEHQPTKAGRFVEMNLVDKVEFLPGLTFQPVLGENMLVNFVHFEPDTEAPVHVHVEEQLVIVVDGSFDFEIDGEVRTLSRGDLAVVPPWVPHGARTHKSSCDEIDVFNPPRTTLLGLAQTQGHEGTAHA
ncbi:MAG: cupin domain-containing protein [Acidimicrobiales bacterium]